MFGVLGDIHDRWNILFSFPSNRFSNHADRILLCRLVDILFRWNPDYGVLDSFFGHNADLIRPLDGEHLYGDLPLRWRDERIEQPGVSNIRHIVLCIRTIEERKHVRRMDHHRRTGFLYGKVGNFLQPVHHDFQFQHEVRERSVRQRLFQESPFDKRKRHAHGELDAERRHDLHHHLQARLEQLGIATDGYEDA
jgi:hypothetical protein